MKILSIDTATWTTSLALWDGPHEIAFEESHLERDQASRLPEILTKVLGDHRPDLILINSGPGSFTGIRLGIAFAKGLAQGWNIPLKAIDGFSSTFSTHSHEKNLLILIDARRKDIFARRYLNGTPGEIQSLTREEIESILLAPHPPSIAGAGFHNFIEGLVYQEATCPLRGAQRLIQSYLNDPTLATDPLPSYAREADVTLCASQR